MVANPRATSSARRARLSVGRLRPLNEPKPVKVEPTGQGEPSAVWPSNHRCAVESVLETWRIDDEWWREQVVSRMYWRVLLEDGCTLDVYHDLARRCWFRQAYSG